MKGIFSNKGEECMFYWLKDNVYLDLKPASDKYKFYDCYSVNDRSIIELKYRTTHYDTLLIEKIKYDKLVSNCAEHDYKPLYINETPKGIYSFNLSLTEPEWQVNYKNPKTTQFTNNNRVPKEVAYLDVKDAIILKSY